MMEGRAGTIVSFASGKIVVQRILIVVSTDSVARTVEDSAPSTLSIDSVRALREYSVEHVFAVFLPHDRTS